jgi:F-type H+-transporting ATPase subunit delta
VITNSVARRYAKGLFDSLETAAIEPTRRSLTDIATALAASPVLRTVLASPGFTFEEKREVLAALNRKVGGPAALTAFFALLIRENRVTLLREIADAFATRADMEKGTRTVAVTSARALAAADQDALRTRLRDLLHRDVDLTFQTDPAVVGGLHIRIGSHVIDGTVRGRLTAMRSLLTKE